MGVKRFTEEEKELLRGNPYTYKVTQCHLVFTAAFKELFWKQYTEGMVPADILRSHGYDPEMLGETRVNGIRIHIKTEFEKEGGFSNRRRMRNTSASKTGSGAAASEDEIRELRNEVEYLRQEVEFLKKISSIKISRKQEESS